MTDYYTGIGSRQTPYPILELMERLAGLFSERYGLRLRSGHAPGADQAFEDGAQGNAEIYLPWQRFEMDAPLGGVPYYPPSIGAREVAAKFHPRWPLLTPAAQLLHARNVHQVLGAQLDQPASFLVCWTRDGSLDGSKPSTGGTGHALRIAAAYGIVVYNLAIPVHLATARHLLASA